MTMNDAFSGLMDDYVLDARERLARVEELLLELPQAEASRARSILEEARRELHTLKGNSGMMGMKQLQALTHRAEDQVDDLANEKPDIELLLETLDAFHAALDSACSGVQPEESQPVQSPRVAAGTGSMRVSFSSLDELVDLLAEMVIFRNRLSDAVTNGRNGADPGRGWEDVFSAEESLGKTLAFIQDRIMRLRMMPLQSLFRYLQRIVFDEGRKEQKQVRLLTRGGDTPMDKALLETASEVLGHLIRNAVIHGIETPDTRTEKGKAAEGMIRLTASTRGNEVTVDVADDGRGIDKQQLLQAASDRGLTLPCNNEEVYSLLFLPGFSTREGADISAGRGMGLSAAMESVRKMGGRVEVFSELGKGSVFRLHMPLSVSITRALIVRADGEDYALPLSAIMESLRFRAGDGHEINHAGTYRWRGGVIPLLDLGHIFGTAEGIRKQGFVVIFQAEGKHRGLIADDLPGIKEIVVKGLDSMVGSLAGLAGSTILGDGHVVLILDPRGLMGIKPFVAAAAGKEQLHGTA